MYSFVLEGVGIFIVLRNLGPAFKGPDYIKGLIFEEYIRKIKRVENRSVSLLVFAPVEVGKRFKLDGFCAVVYLQGQELTGEICSKSNSGFDDQWLYLSSKEGSLCVWSEDFLWFPDWNSKGKNFM